MFNYGEWLSTIEEAAFAIDKNIAKVLPRVVFLESIKTMATNGRNIFVAPSFAEKLTVDQTVGVLGHELLHEVLGHTNPDWEAYDSKYNIPPQRWHELANIAQDAIINRWLLRNGFTLPEHCVTIEGSFQIPDTGQTAWELFQLLIEHNALTDDELAELIEKAVEALQQRQADDDQVQSIPQQMPGSDGIAIPMPSKSDADSNAQKAQDNLGEAEAEKTEAQKRLDEAKKRLAEALGISADQVNDDGSTGDGTSDSGDDTDGDGGAEGDGDIDEEDDAEDEDDDLDGDSESDKGKKSAGDDNDEGDEGTGTGEGDEENQDKGNTADDTARSLTPLGDEDSQGQSGRPDNSSPDGTPQAGKSSGDSVDSSNNSKSGKPDDKSSDKANSDKDAKDKEKVKKLRHDVDRQADEVEELSHKVQDCEKAVKSTQAVKDNIEKINGSDIYDAADALVDKMAGLEDAIRVRPYDSSKMKKVSIPVAYNNRTWVDDIFKIAGDYLSDERIRTHRRPGHRPSTSLPGSSVSQSSAGYLRADGMRKAMFFVDISGSMDDDDVARILQSLRDNSQKLKDTRSLIYLFNTAIIGPIGINDRVRTTGGTDIMNVLRAINSERNPRTIYVVVTDCEDSFDLNFIDPNKRTIIVTNQPDTYKGKVPQHVTMMNVKHF